MKYNFKNNEKVIAVKNLKTIKLAVEFAKQLAKAKNCHVVINPQPTDAERIAGLI